MAKVSSWLIFLVALAVFRTDCVAGNGHLNDGTRLNEVRAKRSDSLDLFETIKLINEISQDEEAILNPPVRAKRSPKGGSVLRRRHARRNADQWKFDFEFAYPHSRNMGRSPPGKRDVSRFRNRKTLQENGERKRSMFLANLLFAQREKMPQPLDTLFSDSLM